VWRPACLLCVSIRRCRCWRSGKATSKQTAGRSATTRRNSASPPSAACAFPFPTYPGWRRTSAAAAPSRTCTRRCCAAPGTVATGWIPSSPTSAYYFDAPPGSYEQRDDPRVEQGRQTITILAPGPDNPEYWTNRGIDEYTAGDLDAAEQAFRKALELKSDYHYAEYNLARVLISTGALEEAAKLLDGLIARDPADLDAIATRGTAAVFLEEYAEAAEYFRRVLRVRSRDANAWYNLGLSLEFLDRPADAESAYRQALHIDPRLTAAQIGLARVRHR